MKTWFKNFFKGWNAFEYAYLFCALSVPTVVGLICHSSCLEIVFTTLFAICAIFMAKGKVECYFLALCGSALFIYYAFKMQLYGELAKEILLVVPLCIFAIVTWLRNKTKDAQKGRVILFHKMSRHEFLLLLLSQVVMAVGYYFALVALKSEMALFSVFTIATYVIAAYLTARRNQFALIGFIVNDLTAIALWIAMLTTVTLSAAVVLVMPAMFLISDIYGVFEWGRLRRRQGHLS